MQHQNTNSHLSGLHINHNNRHTGKGWSQGLLGSPFHVTDSNEFSGAKNTREYLYISTGVKSGPSSGYPALKYLVYIWQSCWTRLQIWSYVGKMLLIISKCPPCFLKLSGTCLFAFIKLSAVDLWERVFLSPAVSVTFWQIQQETVCFFCIHYVVWVCSCPSIILSTCVGRSFVLITLWLMYLCSRLRSARHFINLSGTAARKKKRRAGLTYKADNDSIHASNLRAASALSN